MFKKQTELPPEPTLITGKQICEDLSISGNDPLYSDNVKDIINVPNATDSNSKGETFNPKSFQLIDRILKVKEDMIAEKELLVKESDGLCVLASDLKAVQESIENIRQSY